MPGPAAFDFDSDRLSAYLEEHVPGFRGPLDAEKFAGGQSNPTFLVRAQSGNYVLRRKPPGALLKSAHAVDREFRVMAALRDTDVPVPAVYHLCEDDSIVGSMFFLMEFVDGRVMWDPALPDSSPEERAAVFDEMNRVLAALHSVGTSTTSAWVTTANPATTSSARSAAGASSTGLPRRAASRKWKR